MFEKLRLTNFTAFDALELSFSPGINLFLGENGTGKTHILKILYASGDIIVSKKSFPEKLNGVFRPSNMQIGRLVKRLNSSSRGSVEIVRAFEGGSSSVLKMSLSNHTLTPDKARVQVPASWYEQSSKVVFIPVKDMMANAPGFLALAEARELNVEEVYLDILHRLNLPMLKGNVAPERRQILQILENDIQGKVIQEGEEFFLKDSRGKLEFTLLAEGFRKLGALWTLVQNGTLLEGSTLFWDEPEANLNPKMMKTVVQVLLALQRMGVQIFLATHEYALLKEFDLQAAPKDRLLFHGLYRDDESESIHVRSFASYGEVTPNIIEDTFGDILSRQLQKDLGVTRDTEVSDDFEK